jgi:hypothetical protein
MTHADRILLAIAIKSQVDKFSDRRLNDGDDVWLARETELRCGVAATANAICVALQLDVASFASACGLYVSDGRDNYSDCRPGELTWEAPVAAKKAQEPKQTMSITKNITITDTTKLSPGEKLVLALPGGIAEQEARGQRELVGSEQLPRDGLLGADRASWEGLGLKIDETTGDDPLFCRVELPAGWKKVATDHAMWSHLVDDQGRVRGKIFYKAAFYDRSARLTLVVL